MQKVCATSCAGPFSRVQVFRDAGGRAARLRFDGDLQLCSHPPRVYFDAQGTQTLGIPNEPVEAGSAQARAYAEKQAAEVKDLREAEQLGCFDASACEAGQIKGVVSAFRCRSDSDCASCACAAVNRPEFVRRGGPDGCNVDGEECTATNAVCCDGTCALH